MNKDYLNWHKTKIAVNRTVLVGNFSEREVWWCSLGVNIGDEEDGKHQMFERPFLVLRKYNKRLLFGVPLSTAVKKSQFYHPVAVGDRNGVALLSQARTISSNRLQRRMGRISEAEQQSVVKAYAALHNILSNPQQAEGSRAPNGDLYSHNTKVEHKSQENSQKQNGEEL